MKIRDPEQTGAKERCGEDKRGKNENLRRERGTNKEKEKLYKEKESARGERIAALGFSASLLSVPPGLVPVSFSPHTPLILYNLIVSNLCIVMCSYVYSYILIVL